MLDNPAFDSLYFVNLSTPSSFSSRSPYTPPMHHPYLTTCPHFLLHRLRFPLFPTSHLSHLISSSLGTNIPRPILAVHGDPTQASEHRLPYPEVRVGHGSSGVVWDQRGLRAEESQTPSKRMSVDESQKLDVDRVERNRTHANPVVFLIPAMTVVTANRSNP